MASFQLLTDDPNAGVGAAFDMAGQGVTSAERLATSSDSRLPCEYIGRVTAVVRPDSLLLPLWKRLELLHEDALAHMPAGNRAVRLPKMGPKVPPKVGHAGLGLHLESAKVVRAGVVERICDVGTAERAAHQLSEFTRDLMDPRRRRCARPPWG